MTRNPTTPSTRAAEALPGDSTNGDLTRRSLLGAAAAGLLASCGSKRLLTRPFEGSTKRILVLGGTNFLGPAIVEHAVSRGHEVTLFNRGITRPHLFPGLEKLRGDRAAESRDLGALEGGREFDAVIDVWAQHSGQVRDTAQLLGDRVGYYFFVSSIAAYKDFSRPGLDEDSPTHVDDPGWYGGEKAVAEQLLLQQLGDRAGIARCHAIVGYRDPGAAFHYWIRRIDEFDEVLAPGTGADPVQLTDVRDVAAWVVDCVEHGRGGVHNLCGPAKPPTIRDVLEACRDAISPETRLVWVDADFLRGERKLRSFTDFPLWAPLDEDAGFYQIDTSRSVAAGASFRPIAQTAREARTWFRSAFFDGTSFPRQGQGLSRDVELETLAAWAARPG